MSEYAEIVMLNNAMAQLRAAARQVEQNISNIEQVLQARADGTLEEPSVNTSVLETGDTDISAMLDSYKLFVEDNIVSPFEENLERFRALSDVTQIEFETDAPIFKLTYGPPKTSKGNFILSNTGLYYDSVNGGIPEVSGMAAASATWNLGYAPNLGGKGVLYGKDNFDDFEDTVLDFDYSTNDPMINKFYDTDDILQTFEKNKVHHTTLIHDQISLLTASGFASDSAIVVNHYGNIAAIASTYDQKIKKRKKQLQLVSIFATDTYSFTTTDGSIKDLGLGEGVLIENVSLTDIQSWKSIERVPLNDFSFLKGKGVNVPLTAQEELLLFSEDLEDIILPLTPTFVEAPTDKFSVIEKFSISPTSPETFPYFEGSNEVSGTAGLVQSLHESIIDDGLLLGYNFLTPNVVDASSNSFNVDNITPDSGRSLNAQLVGPSVGEVFPSGLAIPKLNGTYNGGSPSYVRLPSNFTPNGTEQSLTTQELDNLFYLANNEYNKDTKKGGGVTFDCWVHIPSLTTTAAHRYRIIAACENAGGNKAKGNNQGDIYANRTSLSTGEHDIDKVHGMMIGFRDRGGVIGTSGLEFGIFPTVSQNKNDGTFGHSVCIAESMNIIDGEMQTSSISELGSTCASTVSTNGVNILDVSASFVHIAVVFDFFNDTLETYFDAELMKSDSISTTFNLSSGGLPNIPSLTRESDETYDYAESWESTDSLGPVVGNIGAGFTPWILGGGFTDGINRTLGKSTYNPGFLGYNTNSHYGNPTACQHTTTSNTAGMAGTAATIPESGLGGFIGSFKLYTRALSNTEVRKNFTFQKGFYKNIQVS